jgi:hypothetical protein
MHQKKYNEKYKKCYKWDVQRKVQEMLWMFMKWGHMYRGIFWPQERKNESSVPILGWMRNHWRRLCKKVVFHQHDCWVHQVRINWRSGMVEATVQCHGHKDPQPSFIGVIVYIGLKIRKWQDNCINDLLWWFIMMKYDDDLQWCNDDVLQEWFMTIIITRCNSMYMLREMQPYIYILLWLVVYLFAKTVFKTENKE